MVSMGGGVTPGRLRLLRGLCTVRSAGTRGAEAWAHDNWDTLRGLAASAHRGRGGWRSAYASVFVSDSAYQFSTSSIPVQFQPPERAPAFITRRIGVAVALDLIPVLAADGANSQAVLAAYPLHGQSQQHLFSKDIL